MLTAKLLLVYLLQAVSGADIDSTIPTVDHEQAYCLAQNIFYEARNEDIQGQFAVASVTLNRAQDPRYPSTICDVVKQTSVSKVSKKVVCQFSWYCENDKKGKEIPVKNKDGSINQRIVDQFQVASMIAISVINGDVPDNTNGATHFYNPAVANPPWASELIKTKRLGNHNFHKLPPPVDKN